MDGGNDKIINKMMKKEGRSISYPEKIFNTKDHGGLGSRSVSQANAPFLPKTGMESADRPSSPFVQSSSRGVLQRKL